MRKHERNSAEIRRGIRFFFGYHLKHDRLVGGYDEKAWNRFNDNYLIDGMTNNGVVSSALHAMHDFHTVAILHYGLTMLALGDDCIIEGHCDAGFGIALFSQVFGDCLTCG